MSNFEQVHFTVIEQQVFTKSEILKKKKQWQFLKFFILYKFYKNYYNLIRILRKSECQLSVVLIPYQ